MTRSPLSFGSRGFCRFRAVRAHARGCATESAATVDRRHAVGARPHRVSAEPAPVAAPATRLVESPSRGASSESPCSRRAGWRPRPARTGATRPERGRPAASRAQPAGAPGAGAGAAPSQSGSPERSAGAGQRSRAPAAGRRGEGAPSGRRSASSAGAGGRPGQRRPGGRRRRAQTAPGRAPPASAPRSAPADPRPVAATRDERPLPDQARKWGNVARRGAREVGRRGTADPRAGADERLRERRRPPNAGGRAAAPRHDQRLARDDGARDEWEDSAPCARPAPRQPRTPGREGPPTGARDAIASLSARHALPPEIAAEIRNAADVATALHRERLVERAESAYGAYERGRYQDALRAIKPVADEAPGVAAVRELAGLAAYRCGRWREAARHLAGLRGPERLDRAPARADGLPAGAAQAEEGGRAVEPSCGTARPIPTCWPRAGSWRRRRWPTPATSTAPSPCWRRRARRRRCATPPTATSASGTCWPTCTSGPATSPGPASTSSGCSGPTPRPTTWRSACGPGP